MMKRMQRIAVLAMTLCLILGTMAVSVFAEGYEHQLTVSPGNGTGSKLSGKSIQITQDADPYTATLTVDGKTSKVTAPDQNHFVTGLKIAGHDNTSATFTSVSTEKTKEDVDYVVSYGLRSNMIEYTVTYTDLTNGESLGSETFYGVVGEKPVVTFKYFDGYTPANAYNITGTLERGKENVFNFEYYEVDEEGNVVTVVVNDGGAAGAGGAGGAAGGGAAGGAGGAAGGTTIADANTPQAGPADTIDLDNNKTPLAGDTNGDGVVDDKDISDNKTPGTDWSKVGIGAGAAAVVAIAAAIIAKRRKSEDEE